MARAKFPQILSASDLLAGDVVFLGPSGWERDHRKARVAQLPSESAALVALGQAEAAANRILDANLIDVEIDSEGCPVPLHYRERLRTLGPSVRPDLGKQANLGSRR